MPPFHLAFPVCDLEKTRHFFVEVLGCGVGRTDERWIDFDFRGHQLSAHLVDPPLHSVPSNEVDGDGIPVRHFGLVLEWDEWHAWVETLVAKNTRFLLAPKLRFAGEVGEQATFFVADPSGNAIEFKAFRDPARLFAR